MRKIEASKPFAFFLELLLAIFFFAISSMIILQVYASAIQKNQLDDDKRKAMLFAQNVIEGEKDLQMIKTSYDKDFKEEGDYFQVEIEESNERFPHYILYIWKDKELLVEYTLYTGEKYE